MPADLDTMLASLRAEGALRFASWDAALFDAVARGPARALAESLDGRANAEKVLHSYLRLVQEAVGNRLLRRASSSEAGWTSFLERCLVEIVPAKLSEVPAGDQARLLADVWNLGEGLLRGPAWVDRYVTTCASDLQRLTDLQPFLVATLEPVLTPPPPAAWQGLFAVQVLDLRPAQEDFLPGPMRLAAPCVLGVADRRRPDRQVAVLLRHGRQSKLLGPVGARASRPHADIEAGGTPALRQDDYAESGDLPAVAFEDQRVRIGGHEVAVPFLRRAVSHAVARAGFVAACAVDSQQLWVVESR
jgi:hypothetical protein